VILSVRASRTGQGGETADTGAVQARRPARQARGPSAQSSETCCAVGILSDALRNPQFFRAPGRPVLDGLGVAQIIEPAVPAVQRHEMSAKFQQISE
jgi:hypothetical protein